MAILRREGGSRFMYVTDANVNYPSDGAGAVTTTAASSELVAENREVVIDSITLLAVHTAATTITVFKQDGTTALFVLNIPAAAAGVSVQTTIALGGAGLGLRVPPVSGIYAFSAQSSNAGTKFLLTYRRTRN